MAACSCWKAFQHDVQLFVFLAQSSKLCAGFGLLFHRGGLGIRWPRSFRWRVKLVEHVGLRTLRETCPGNPSIFGTRYF